MRTRLVASALAFTAPLIAAAPAHADAVKKKRLHVRVGRTVVVVGETPGGVAALQLRRRGAWRTIDRDRTTASGRFVLRDRMRRPISTPARLVADGGTTRRLGRVNAFRVATASWYGPGLYGNHLGCGGRLTPGRLGVAHKWLPCGAKVTLRKGSRTVRVRVIDRGPYVGGREFDLTEATARRLQFHGPGAVLATR